MRKLPFVFMLAIVGSLAPGAWSQDKAKTADEAKVARRPDTTDPAKGVVPLKVTIVFNEYEGEKKLSGLPYTLFLRAGERETYRGSLRMGVRVPIAIGGKDGQIQYQDVGSNLDCRVQSIEDGKYVLDLVLERSSVYPTSEGKEGNSGDTRNQEQPRANQPVLRTFRGDLALVLRDGQTTQSMMATDPLSGHVIKVDVTLNVLK
jgi:hypothetical protein